MMDKETETNEGQKPEFIKEVEDGYFFDIYAFANDDQISFSTRWSPNIKDVVKIAKNWQGLDFELLYQEPGNLIFGKSIFKDGLLTIQDLTEQEVNEIEFDHEGDFYLFRGEKYESEHEPLEELFKEKFNLSY